MKIKNEWWCYLHTNGHIQAKRFFDHRDFEDADESPFVKKRSGIILASDRDDAIEQFYNTIVSQHVLHELTKNHKK